MKSEIQIYESAGPEETFELGRRMALKLREVSVIALGGYLGAGKTVFTKGLAKGLNIEELVTSPTFTILMEYDKGRLPLYHFDTYRIEDADEMEEIGFADYLYGNGVCVIEWAETIKEILPEDLILIDIRRDPARGESYRRIEVKGGDML